MSGVAIAVGVAGAAVAAGTSVMQANAAKKAGEENRKMIAEGRDMARGQIERYSDQAIGYQDPYRTAGGDMLQRISDQQGLSRVPVQPRQNDPKYNGVEGYRAFDRDLKAYKARMKELGVAETLGAPPRREDFINPNNKRFQEDKYSAAMQKWKAEAAHWARRWDVESPTAARPALGAPPDRAKYTNPNNGKFQAAKYNADMAAWRKEASQWAKRWDVAVPAGDNAAFEQWYASTAQPAGGSENKFDDWYNTVATGKIAESDKNRAAFEQEMAGNAGKQTVEGIAREAGDMYRRSGTYYAPVNTEAQFQQDAGYAPQVYDESTWKAAGDPSYVADPGEMRTLEDLKANDPGYDFRLRQGAEAVKQNAAARGLLASGGALKELTEYNQNFASGEFQNAWSRNFQTRDQRARAFDAAVARRQNAFNAAFQRGQNAANSFWGRYLGAKGIETSNQQWLVGVGQQAANQSSAAAQNAGAQIASTVSNAATNSVEANSAAVAGQNQAWQNAAGAVIGGARDLAAYQGYQGWGNRNNPQQPRQDQTPGQGHGIGNVYPRG